MRTIVVGAGLAGLAAALTAAKAGREVVVIEAAPAAGGRCRSLDDPLLGRRIDNGSHVLVGANPAALAFLDEIGARDSLRRVSAGGIPFADLGTGERWTWRAGRPVPGCGLLAHLRDALCLLAPDRGRTVSEVLVEGPLMRRFWEPLTVAALNTSAERASAGLLRNALAEVVRRGPQGLDLHMARRGLSDSLVDPALARLAATGVRTTYGERVVGLVGDGRLLREIRTTAGSLELRPGDNAVLGVPSTEAVRLIPGLDVPLGSNPIVNVHYRIDPDVAPIRQHPAMGLVGGAAHWIFRRDDVVSVTVSDAASLMAPGRDDVAGMLWRDVVRALELESLPVPPARVVREKRATFDQTPANERRRPGATTMWRNLFLAGDWTATGLPATIEGAIRSGRRAGGLAAAD